MIRVIVLTMLQCCLLAGGQICFKLAVEKISKFQFTWVFFSDILTNWWLLASGVFLVSSTILWGYVLKHFDFSVAYPLTACAYIFGMLAAIFIFHETVPLTRWIGVGLIITGVILVAK